MADKKLRKDSMFCLVCKKELETADNSKHIVTHSGVHLDCATQWFVNNFREDNMVFECPDCKKEIILKTR